MLLDFMRYLYKATNHHGIHSPFVFELYNTLIRSSEKPEVYSSIEFVRKSLRKNHKRITIKDFGAGSRKTGKNQRKIADIVRSAEKAPKWGILFHHIISKFNYTTIFDLGTSFGLTTAYEASANPRAKVTTFEGCPETADVASENFKKLGLANIDIVKGNIDETLPLQLEKVDRLDFVFFDANHRLEPTLRYFQCCLEKKHEHSCFVFDDIYWSEGMKMAWSQIKEHSEVTVTIDLFFVGLVFFRKGQAKEHFTLR